MAMNGNTMGDAIEAAIESVYGSVPATETAKMKAMWEAVATVIVAHIKNNMVVTSTVSAGIAVTTSAGNGSTSAPGTAASSSIA